MTLINRLFRFFEALSRRTITDRTGICVEQLENRYLLSGCSICDLAPDPVALFAASEKAELRELQLESPPAARSSAIFGAGIEHLSNDQIPSWAQERIDQDGGELLDAFAVDNNAFVVHYENAFGNSELLYQDSDLNQPVSLIDALENNAGNSSRIRQFVTHIDSLELRLRSAGRVSVLQMTGTATTVSAFGTNEGDFSISIILADVNISLTPGTVARAIGALDSRPFVGPLPANHSTLPFTPIATPARPAILELPPNFANRMRIEFNVGPIQRDSDKKPDSNPDDRADEQPERQESLPPEQRHHDEELLRDDGDDENSHKNDSKSDEFPADPLLDPDIDEELNDKGLLNEKPLDATNEDHSTNEGDDAEIPEPQRPEASTKSDESSETDDRQSDEDADSRVDRLFSDFMGDAEFLFVPDATRQPNLPIEENGPHPMDQPTKLNERSQLNDQQLKRDVVIPAPRKPSQFSP